MSLRNPVFKFILLVILGRTITGCKSAADIPFPQDDGYAQPVTVPLKFGSPQKLSWPEKPASLSSVSAGFNFDKLPAIRFDSSGFTPFPQPPAVLAIDWNKLPTADYNYDSLPAIPLRFKTSILPPPDIARINRPYLKSSKSEIVYELGDQLSDSRIDGLFKTRDGFIWITTEKGLYRYDGENIYHYKVYGLTTTIFQLAEDRDGKIWLSTNNGLFAVDLKNGISRQLSVREGLLSNFSPRLIVDHENRIWANLLPTNISIGKEINTGSVAIIDQDTKTVRFLQATHGLSTNSPSGIVETSNQQIWVATINGGLNIIDPKTKKIIYLNKEHGLSTDTLTTLYQDRSGAVWAGAFFGNLNRVDPDQGTITTFTERQGFSRSFNGRIINDHDGNIWIGRDGDIKILDPTLRLVKTIDHSSGLNETVNSQIVEDDLHQMFIGSYAGLNMISKNGLSVHRVGTMPISTLLADAHGHIWVGTLGKGIQIVDTATGLARIYNGEHGLSDNLIQTLANINGGIILSTQKGGIEIIDSTFKKIERIGLAQGLATANITAIETDKQNNIWLGGANSRGLDVLDLQHKKIWHVGLGKGVNDSTIIDIKKDKEDQLWFYSVKCGLGVINTENRTVRQVVQSQFSSLTGAIDDNLLMIDKMGDVWLGSSTDGLFVINHRRDSVTHFTTAQGLLSNSLTSLKEYDGRIYAGTALGLSILTPPMLSDGKNWKIESFGKRFGIFKNANTYNSDLILDNGQYWWGDAGLTLFNNLGGLVKDSTVPATYITGFEIYNHQQFFVDNPWENSSEKDTIWNSGRKSDTFFVNHASMPQLSVTNRGGLQWDSLDDRYNLPANLRLPYNRNYLQFHFVQANLGSQDTVWYRYILEGIDQEWSEKTTKIASENYPGVSPGYYRFKVSSLYRGIWSEPVIFAFSISPPWWNTWWAWLVYSIAILAAVRLLIDYRSRSLVREKNLLEQNVKLRTEEVLKQKEEISAQRDNIEQALDELKATQSQLIQSEKMASLGELTAGIAHEIQNPLNFINNFSEVNTELIAEMKAEIEKGNLEEVKNIADDIAVNEQKINHHGKRADGIVKGMLQHSRTGNRQKEAANINNIADEYLRLAYHGLRAKDKSFNAQVHTDFDDSITSIQLIPQDIGRVILNLITNAFYAVTEKKKQQGDGYDPAVSVSTKKTGSNVEVRVRDNGNGVPQKVLEKIFQPFFTTKPAGAGTGLGLSLSYDIVKAHQGDLRVETKEGEYAEFIMQLPI